MNHINAELAMQKGKYVRRAGWPAGKYAYHDVDGDTIPDKVDITSPDFIKNAQIAYANFQRSIRVIGGAGTEENRSFITQEDSLAEDWQEFDVAP